MWRGTIYFWLPHPLDERDGPFRNAYSACGARLFVAKEAQGLDHGLDPSGIWGMSVKGADDQARGILAAALMGGSHRVRGCDRARQAPYCGNSVRRLQPASARR